MSGEEVRKLILANNVKLWEVAKKAFGISDGNFSRKLRKDFSDEELQKVIVAIEELKSEKRKTYELFQTIESKK
ncbi:hypothetical protein [Ruminococcus albus]|uniref:Uncharacterized protein n=1 Tax=Ruminococcus albus TaxID=1264 RepID=A0A1H7Q167_RUMAL|nr:hypothetical protein [Ruminococcus albus]SEL41881.1 hypothetical protein SAMN05216469_1287 [Ruminococcus albus]